MSRFGVEELGPVVADVAAAAFKTSGIRFKCRSTTRKTSRNLLNAGALN